MLISKHAVCRVLNLDICDWEKFRKHCAPDLNFFEFPRTERGRSTYYYPMHLVVEMMDRILPRPLSSDTIRRLHGQAEPEPA